MKISGPLLASIDRESDLYKKLEQAHLKIAEKDPNTWGSKASAEATTWATHKSSNFLKSLGRKSLDSCDID
jgi:hypothetical protein